MTDVPSQPPGEPDRTDERLRAETLGPDPILAFEAWMSRAHRDAGMAYANACTLSTVDADGVPAGRIVLLKGVDDRGFVFFTNYRSAKGEALTVHPRAALTFYWDALGRQVRVRGSVERISADASDAYFAGRPRMSRLGAWASEQSRPLADRDDLEARFLELEKRYAGREIPRPPHWGGYRLSPVEIEFWAAGDGRLHDRFVFKRETPDGGWSVTRLNP